MNDKLAYEIIKASLRDDVIDTKSFFPREVSEVCLQALEKQMRTCEDCLHSGPLQISHNTVFCSSASQAAHTASPSRYFRTTKQATDVSAVCGHSDESQQKHFPQNAHSAHRTRRQTGSPAIPESPSRRTDHRKSHP